MPRTLAGRSHRVVTRRRAAGNASTSFQFFNPVLERERSFSAGLRARGGSSIKSPPFVPWMKALPWLTRFAERLEEYVTERSPKPTPARLRRPLYGLRRPLTVLLTPPRVLLTLLTVSLTLSTVLFTVSLAPPVPGTLMSGTLIVEGPDEPPPEEPPPEELHPSLRSCRGRRSSWIPTLHQNRRSRCPCRCLWSPGWCRWWSRRRTSTQRRTRSCWRVPLRLGSALWDRSDQSGRRWESRD